MDLQFCSNVGHSCFTFASLLLHSCFTLLLHSCFTRHSCRILLFDPSSLSATGCRPPQFILCCAAVPAVPSAREFRADSLRGQGRKYGTTVSGWSQLLVSQIGVLDHAPPVDLESSSSASFISASMSCETHQKNASARAALMPQRQLSSKQPRALALPRYTWGASAAFGGMVCFTTGGERGPSHRKQRGREIPFAGVWQHAQDYRALRRHVRNLDRRRHGRTARDAGEEALRCTASQPGSASAQSSMPAMGDSDLRETHLLARQGEGSLDGLRPGDGDDLIDDAVLDRVFGDLRDEVRLHRGQSMSSINH